MLIANLICLSDVEKEPTRQGPRLLFPSAPRRVSSPLIGCLLERREMLQDDHDFFNLPWSFGSLRFSRGARLNEH